MDNEVLAVRVVGRVRWFNIKRGFGVINLGRSGKYSQFWPQVFTHHTSVRCPLWELKQGRLVEFNLRMTARGPVAEDLTTRDKAFGSTSDKNKGAI